MQQFLDPSPRIHLIFAGRGFSWVESFRVGIILVGYFPDGSNPGQLFSWWELSLWELSWVGIFLGVNFPSWNYRVGIIGVAIFRVGVFMLPRGRGGVTNHVYVGTYIIFYLFGSFFLIVSCFISRNLTLPLFKKDVFVRNDYFSPSRLISVVMKEAFFT